MRKTLTLTIALTFGPLASLAHACPPRVSAAELFSEAHAAQTAKCRAGPKLARAAELEARAACDYHSLLLLEPENIELKK
jgi:hypothetical protein